MVLSPVQARLLRGLKTYDRPFAKQKAIIDAVDNITVFLSSAYIALYAMALGFVFTSFWMNNFIFY